MEGKPYFAVVSGDSNITLKKSVQENEETYHPPTRALYLNRPYDFKTKQEFEELVEEQVPKLWIRFTQR